MEMIEILYLLHEKLEALSVPIFGVDVQRSISFKPEATQPQRDQAHAITDGFNTLTVTATAPGVNTPKLTITANGTDETQIKSGVLQSFTYTIWRDGVQDSTGSANDGVLELSAASAGTYLIEVKSGNSTGYIELEAVNG